MHYFSRLRRLLSSQQAITLLEMILGGGAGMILPNYYRHQIYEYCLTNIEATQSWSKLNNHIMASVVLFSILTLSFIAGACIGKGSEILCREYCPRLCC